MARQLPDGSWDSDGNGGVASDATLAEGCYAMVQGNHAHDVALTSLVLLSALGQDATGSGHKGRFRAGQAWLLSSQNSDGSFGIGSHARQLRHSAMATLLLGETTRLGVGDDVTDSGACAVANLLDKELLRGGWALCRPDEYNLLRPLATDPITTTWAALALTSHLIGGRLSKGTHEEAKAALERAARSFANLADPSSGLIQVDGEVSLAKSLCGLVIRELNGEDLGQLASIETTRTLLTDLRPDWREDPTYFVFMTWLMQGASEKAGRYWDKWGAKDPLRFGATSSQDAARIRTVDDAGLHEAGSRGAQALGDLSLGFYFRYRILFEPPEKAR